MPLFKYVKPELTVIVESCRIRFTPASELNDPFECLPDARIVEHPRWIKQVEEDFIKEADATESIQAAILACRLRIAGWKPALPQSPPSSRVKTL